MFLHCSGSLVNFFRLSRSFRPPWQEMLCDLVSDGSTRRIMSKANFPSPLCLPTGGATAYFSAFYSCCAGPLRGSALQPSRGFLLSEMKVGSRSSYRTRLRSQQNRTCGERRQRSARPTFKTRCTPTLSRKAMRVAYCASPSRPLPCRSRRRAQ